MAKPWLSGTANGKYLGEVLCSACNEPALYKTKRLCRRCYDRQRQTGVVIGPPRSTNQPQFPECQAQNCSKPVKGLGMCQRHYSQYRRMVLHKPS